MKKTTLTQWTDKEFKAYLFMYCALADHIEVREERNHILSLVDRDEFFGILEEIEEDSDAQGLKKIKKHVKNANYTAEQSQRLVTEVLALFMADGKFHRLEKGMYKTLHRILTA